MNKNSFETAFLKTLSPRWLPLIALFFASVGFFFATLTPAHAEESPKTPASSPTVNPPALSAVEGATPAPDAFSQDASLTTPTSDTFNRYMEYVRTVINIYADIDPFIEEICKEKYDPDALAVCKYVIENSTTTECVMTAVGGIDLLILNAKNNNELDDKKRHIISPILQRQLSLAKDERIYLIASRGLRRLGGRYQEQAYHFLLDDVLSKPVENTSKEKRRWMHIETISMFMDLKEMDFQSIQLVKRVIRQENLMPFLEAYIAQGPKSGIRSGHIYRLDKLKEFSKFKEKR